MKTISKRKQHSICTDFRYSVSSEASNIPGGSGRRVRHRTGCDGRGKAKRGNEMNISTYEVRVQRVQECPGSVQFDGPDCALHYWNEKLPSASWFDPEREMVVAVMLNTRLVATTHTLVSIGSLNESIVHPRDVFRAAVATGAYGIFLMHNHPSGDPSPSEEDRRSTLRIQDAGNILGIRLIDHVIIGDPEVAPRGLFSFCEEGLLSKSRLQKAYGHLQAA